MFRVLMLLAMCAFPLLAAAAPPTGDGDSHFGLTDNSCSIDTEYRMRLDAGGLELVRKEDGPQAGAGRPERIGISDGALVLDGARQPVSDADAARLRQIESGVRDSLPEVAAITRAAIGLTFDTLASVNVALAGNKRHAREFDELRARSLARVDEMVGRGEWSTDVFGEEFEAEIEAAAEAMAARFTPRRAIWMVMTGGIGRMERRMEAMEAELEQKLPAYEASMERHAQALCGKLQQVERLQDAMDLRLDDGRPLQVIRIRPPENDGGGEEAGAG